jgi:predicted AAA+ superfamily ATPase
MIERKLTSHLVNLLDHFPVIGIIGPRQVGKTTFIKNNFQHLRKGALYLDLESPEDYNKLTDAELFLKNFDHTTVVIDEIQHMPELFPLIRSLVDKNRIPGRFVILGSASPGLIRDSSESLAGRVAYLELNPLDIVELKGIKSIEHIWFNGGFPDAVLEKDPDICATWLRNYTRTYIERDLPLLGFGAPVKTTEKLCTMLAHTNGNLLNYSQLAGSLGVSANTVKSYIQFFEKSFLIRTLQPYYINIRKRLVKSPKLYFRDTGILHHLLRALSINDLFAHPGIGNSWEAFVLQQIISNLPADLDIHFYRTQDGSELDVVLSKGVRISAGIEIKYSNAPALTKGNTLAINTLNSPANYILTPSSDDYPIRKNIQVCSLERFIFHYLPALVVQ